MFLSTDDDNDNDDTAAADDAGAFRTFVTAN